MLTRRAGRGGDILFIRTKGCSIDIVICMNWKQFVIIWATPFNTIELFFISVHVYMPDADMLHKWIINWNYENTFIFGMIKWCIGLNLTHAKTYWIWTENNQRFQTRFFIIGNFSALGNGATKRGRDCLAAPISNVATSLLDATLYDKFC